MHRACDCCPHIDPTRAGPWANRQWLAFTIFPLVVPQGQAPHVFPKALSTPTLPHKPEPFWSNLELRNPSSLNYRQCRPDFGVMRSFVVGGGIKSSKDVFTYYTSLELVELCPQEIIRCNSRCSGNLTPFTTHFFTKINKKLRGWWLWAE